MMQSGILKKSTLVSYLSPGILMCDKNGFQPKDFQNATHPSNVVILASIPICMLHA
jgi:hypothetical protein